MLFSVVFNTIHIVFIILAFSVLGTALFFFGKSKGTVRYVYTDLESVAPQWESWLNRSDYSLLKWHVRGRVDSEYRGGQKVVDRRVTIYNGSATSGIRIDARDVNAVIFALKAAEKATRGADV